VAHAAWGLGKRRHPAQDSPQLLDRAQRASRMEPVDAYYG
jgi:hypothetical protein